MDDEIRALAVSLLDQVVQWKRMPGAWEEISGVLDAVAAAVERGDGEAADMALADLELCGPYMLTRAMSSEQRPDAPTPDDSAGGSASQPSKAVPIPLALRERVNTLVHRLGPGPGPEAGR